MAIRSLNTIKNWFKAGLRPTQDQFRDVWDSYFHKQEKIPINAVGDLENIINNKIDAAELNTHINDNNAHGITDKLEEKANKKQLESLEQNTQAKLEEKVDKKENYELSKNDFTDELKNKLENFKPQDLDSVLEKSNMSENSIILKSFRGTIGINKKGSTCTIEIGNDGHSEDGSYTTRLGYSGLSSEKRTGKEYVSTYVMPGGFMSQTNANGKTNRLRVEFPNEIIKDSSQKFQNKSGTIALLEDIPKISDNKTIRKIIQIEFTDLSRNQPQTLTVAFSEVKVGNIIILNQTGSQGEDVFFKGKCAVNGEIEIRICYLGGSIKVSGSFDLYVTVIQVGN